MEKYIGQLLKRGFCELALRGPNNEKIYLVYREANNPKLKPDQKISYGEFLGKGKFSHGYNTMISLDLVAESNGGYQVVGFMDHKLVRFNDKCVASGNFANRRGLFKNHRVRKFRSALKTHDENMPVVESGTRINENLRNKKLGKFFLLLAIYY